MPCAQRNTPFYITLFSFSRTLSNSVQNAIKHTYYRGANFFRSTPSFFAIQTFFEHIFLINSSLSISIQLIFKSPNYYTQNLFLKRLTLLLRFDFGQYLFIPFSRLLCFLPTIFRAKRFRCFHELACIKAFTSRKDLLWNRLAFMFFLFKSWVSSIILCLYHLKHYPLNWSTLLLAAQFRTTRWIDFRCQRQSRRFLCLNFKHDL